MLAGHFRAMARNNAWSNYRLHRACAELSEIEYRAARVSFFPSIPLTLSHILTVDWYYLDALEKGGRGYAVFEKDEPYDTLAGLTTAQRASDRRLLAFCDNLDDRGVAAPVILDRGAAGMFEETAAAILSHLFVHQIHHRGQVPCDACGHVDQTTAARRVLPQAGCAAAPRRVARSGIGLALAL
jgi:uncharacterized damage-inducible protein DinB